MRILLVNVVLKTGSTGKITYDLYSAYKEQGHEAKVCYGRGNTVSGDDFYRFTRKREVYMDAAKTRLTGLSGGGCNAATKRLITYIDRFDPDIVHLHNIHGYYVNAFALLEYLKRRGVRTVITMHDEWLFTGKCGHAYDCERWRNRCGNCPQVSTYPKSLFFDRTRRAFDLKQKAFSGFTKLTLASVSDWLKNRASESVILGGKRFVTIPNGIDTQLFQPNAAAARALREKYGLGESRVILHVTPGFDDPNKGGKYVLQLAGLLRAEDIKLVVVGASSAPANLPDNVTLIPRTENQEQLAAFYTLADLLLLTSGMESLPTVALESLCCGTPVIGFDCGGARDAAPMPYGHFVSYGDMDAFKQLTLDALNGAVPVQTPDECAAFGKERYGKERMAENYLHLYEEML